MDEADVRRFYADLSAGRWDELQARLADDVVLEFPGRRFGARVEGRRRVLVFLRQNQRLFRDGLHFTLHWVGMAGERAVAQWTNAGTTKTGKAYANRGVTILHLRDGRVVRLEDYLDTELLSETWPA